MKHVIFQSAERGEPKRYLAGSVWVYYANLAMTFETEAEAQATLDKAFRNGSIDAESYAAAEVVDA